MPRFVILEHDHPALHWDLMLEASGVLQTWRLASPPTGPEPIEAIAQGDHRRMYLDCEGPVSGNRGTVRRWDAGHFEEEAGSTPQSRLLRFCGSQIEGCWRLEQTDAPRWKLEPVEITEPPPA